MKTPDLKARITSHLATVTDATAKQIARALGLVNYPSLVATALNDLRTDAAVECEKKKGKGNEYWYWLSDIGQHPTGGGENDAARTQADSGDVTAAGTHRGTRVAGGKQRAAPPPEGAPSIVEPPKPEQAPAEAGSDDRSGDQALDIALRHHHLITRICIAAGFSPDADLEDLPAQIERQAARIGELEIAVDAAQQTIASMELEAEQASTAGAAAIEHTARGYLVCAPKRKPAKLAKEHSAMARARSAAIATGRSEVFALVPVGVAVRKTLKVVEFNRAGGQ